LTGRSIKVVLGVLTAAAPLWSLVMPDNRISDYGLVLIGVVFVASPWVMGFDDLSSMALTAWVVGAVTAITGLLGMPVVEKRVHHRPIAH
jgi:hypothetical protein